MTTSTPTSFKLGRASLAAGAFFLVLSQSLEGARGDAGGITTLTGAAVVIDGDTIEIGGQRIRLEGIDAPETAQSCQRRNGEAWACGTEASRALRALLVNGDIACDSRGSDKYGRVLATCFADGKDINAAMVKTGNAWAFVKYSETYLTEQKTAQASSLGVWQGAAVAPWEFRHTGWQAAEATAQKGCAIKGNISHGNQIYHMPWSPWYDKVKIDPDRGERWFCSEADAEAAGWRAVLTN
jgi:endonuclease YncB( thermonuclease family)